SEAIVLANQWGGQTFATVHKVPGELALDTGGDTVGGRVNHGLNLKDVPVSCPYLERTPHATIGTDRLSAFDLGLTPLHIHIGNGGDGRRVRTGCTGPG